MHATFSARFYTRIRFRQIMTRLIPIYTGMSFDKITFETSRLPNWSVLCPECGQTHIWNKQHAYLESEEDAHQP